MSAVELPGAIQGRISCCSGGRELQNAYFEDLRPARQRRRPRAERADGCSWMVAKYFGISERDTLRTWTVLESVLSVAAFAVAAVVSLFV